MRHLSQVWDICHKQTISQETILLFLISVK